MPLFCLLNLPDCLALALRVKDRAQTCTCLHSALSYAAPYIATHLVLVAWRRSVVVSALASINVVNRHCARLVLGWVTVYGRVNHLA